MRAIYALALLLNSTLLGAPMLERATFAGGCFWCMEPPFEKLSGVKKVVAGYANGDGTAPTYQNYADHGYVEAIDIEYDPTIVSYNTLLDVFWRNINPTDQGGQFNDRGPQYRSEIFYHSSTQQKEAEQSKIKLEQSKRFNKTIVTNIVPFKNFFPAEQYHQDYARKNPIKYGYYRYNSGRDAFIKKNWKNQMNTLFKKPTDEQLRKKLTAMQYKVTQKNGTEPPFDNLYNDNYQPGIYVDIVSGEPLFSSIDKYDSKTGWPSFKKPLEPDNIIEKQDKGWFTTRTEVRSKHADSHLGHVFNDGPPPTGLRYCINSAALNFIPKDKLEEKGYGKYLHLFR